MIETQLTANVVTFNTDGTILYRDGVTQSEWFEVHRKLMHCKRFSSAWIKKSREIAAEFWGVDFVAESEIQMEMDFGMIHTTKPETLNPADKSTRIITIEGINQYFTLWQRKMGDEIEEWDKLKLKRALDLLEPMERQAKRVRELLGR